MKDCKFSPLFVPGSLSTSYGSYTWVVATPDCLDPSLHTQILSQYKKEWPFGFVGVNKDRQWIALSSDNPIHIILVDRNGAFASHVAFVSRTILVEGQSYLSCGIMGVFTRKGFRYGFLAPRIIRYVIEVLVPTSNADLAMGFCEEHLVKYYERLGLTPIRNTHIRVDTRNPGEPTLLTKENNDEVLIAFPVNEKGTKAIEAIQNGKEMYFGSRPLW